MTFSTIEAYIGNTPLVRLQRLVDGEKNTLLVKLEGNNPAGSVKDRPAMSMIQRAEARGDIKPGDSLIEATSGLILVSREESMEGARDLAKQMQAEGRGKVLDQFANQDNPRAHYHGTGPEIWEQTQGKITHFVSSMGTTGTIVGTSKFLKEQNPEIQVIGLQPEEGASIPGIRRWPEAYLPDIFDDSNIDRVVNMSQSKAENTMKELARKEGIFCGVSSGGAVAAALDIAKTVENAVIVAIICDRGDRYLSSGIFKA